MIRCPNCLNEEMVGALFCNECGTQLVYEDGIPTSNLEDGTDALDQSPPLQTDLPEHTPFYPISLQNATLSLNIINHNEMITIDKQNEITLGRISTGQPIVPDIDLTPYEAYEAGVSRMHLSIKIGDETIIVTDLGSVNGTRVNGRKIAAHTPQPIKNGDILTLGKFKIQILLES